MEKKSKLVRATIKRVIVAIDHDSAKKKTMECYDEIAESFAGQNWTMEISPPLYDDKFEMITILVHINYEPTNNDSRRR